MKHLKTSFILMMLLTLIIGSQTSGQNIFNDDAKLRTGRAKDILQGNDDTDTGCKKQIPLGNPLMVNGAAIAAQTTQFTIPVKEKCDPINGTSAVVQNLFLFDVKLKAAQAMKEQAKLERAKEVMQDNEYIGTGHEQGQFYDNPLVLNGKPLDYGEFNSDTEGELTVNKGAAITGQTIHVPFYVYLRRNGNKLLIPGKEKPDSNQIKVDLSEILQYAEPGDHLVVEAVNREDGAVKRILKILGAGC